MRIKSIRNVSENYQISLSTDDKKNINVIMGGLAAGKTTLFNKIKSCLARTKDNSGIELELSGGTDGNADYIFVDERNAYPHDLLDHLNGAGFAEYALADIRRRTNLMLQSIHGVFDYERNLLHMENGKVVTSSNLAAGPTTILYFAILLALREHKGAELPLIVDNTFRMDPLFAIRLIRMIADNAAQALLFLNDMVAMSPMSAMGPMSANREFPTVHASVYDGMKRYGILGSLHVLNRHGIFIHEEGSP